MKSRTVLLQWIGHSDLRAMAATLPSVKQRQLLDRIGGDASPAGDHGPTKTLLTTQDFDEVRLLSNYPQEWNQWYLKWLDVKSTVVIPVELPKPTDYVAIYRIADAELSKLRQRAAWNDTQLCLHLSPGTPAMAAVWVLLGKTRYPAKFLETFAGKSWVTDIPFDLTIDVLPEPRVATVARRWDFEVNFAGSPRSGERGYSIWRRKARRTSRGLRTSPVRAA